jgi:hypothetical protein
MTIEISEGIAALWYVSWPGADWMAGAWTDADGSPMAKYRFRYYQDREVFDSTDTKSWFVIKRKPGCPAMKMEELIDVLSIMATRLAEEAKAKKWEFVRGSSSRAQFMEQFQQLPFVHMKTLNEMTTAQENHHDSNTIGGGHR